MVYHEYKKLMVQLEGRSRAIEIVDSATAAKLLGITLSSFQTYISRGSYKLDVIKIHIHNYYIKSQVLKLAESRYGKEK